jgi:glycosyltransferase involved in cell wall biosynthesis
MSGPYHAWRWPTAGRSFAYDSREKGIQGVNCLGLSANLKGTAITREAKWMVTPPHTQEDLGLTPLEARSVGVPCIASTDGGVKETAGAHALFCKPGCVNGLAECLKTAMQMKEDKYAERSIKAKENLDHYVRPLDEYAYEYLKLLSQK